jgi:hypothetical protein
MKIRQLAFHNQLPYYLHIDNTNAVLPIAGLAAIIIKSLGCQPEVILSNSKPVATPPSCPAISSILFFSCNTKLWAVSELRFIFLG